MFDLSIMPRNLSNKMLNYHNSRFSQQFLHVDKQGSSLKSFPMGTRILFKSMILSIFDIYKVLKHWQTFSHNTEKIYLVHSSMDFLWQWIVLGGALNLHTFIFCLVVWSSPCKSVSLGFNWVTVLQEWNQLCIEEPVVGILLHKHYLLQPEN